MPFINERLDWEDLRLFRAVAQEGGLVGASVASGASAPTLSRRMRKLEEKAGIALFDRSHNAYDLTPQGRELLTRVHEMWAHSQSIQSWLSQLDQRPVVRISAGYWSSQFLARHLGDFCPAKDGVRVEILTGAQFVNLSRREADIAIRNKAPEQPGLKRHRLGQVAFAIYGSKSFCADHPQAHDEARYTNCDWVLPSKTGGTGSSSFWLQQKIGAAARLTCDSPQSVLEATANGAGLCVLPKFIGDGDPRLERCSAPIHELEHTQWLVAHQEGTGLTPIRRIFRNLAKVYEKHQDAFH